MSAVSDKKMSQQDLLVGLQVFEESNQKAKYLARALLNGKAKVEDVAAIAFNIVSIEMADGGTSTSTDEKFSLVLPILFHMKTKGDCSANDVIKRFRDAVNEQFGNDHVRRLVTIETVIPWTDGKKGRDLVNQGLSSRSNIIERAYFLANVIIANLEVDWKDELTPELKMDPDPVWKLRRSFEPKVRCQSKKLESFVLEQVSNDQSLALYLDVFLKEVSGDDKVISGYYGTNLQKVF